MLWKGWTCVAGLATVAACTFETSAGDGGGGLGDESGGMDTETSADTENGSDTTTGMSASGTSQGSSPTSDPTSDPTHDPSDTDDPTDDPSDTDDPTDDPSDTDDPTDGSSTGDPPDGPNVQIAGEAFDTIALGGAGTREFTMTNDGDADANNVTVEVIGEFTLDSDNCPGTLGPGDSCAATVSRSGSVLGPFSGLLQVTYDEGMDDELLEVDVVGSTGNLLNDGGFESCSGDPWVVFNGAWECGDVWDDIDARSGDGYLAAVEGNNQPFTYRLEIDITPYANAISTGEMSFEFTGWARSYVFNDDEYRFRLRYREGDTDASQYASGWQTGGTWTEYTDSRMVPSGVDTARIELQCDKDGGDYCDAYFDDIELIGSYAP